MHTNTLESDISFALIMVCRSAYSFRGMVKRRLEKEGQEKEKEKEGGKGGKRRREEKEGGEGGRI
jgi:hypothetical protein